MYQSDGITIANPDAWNRNNFSFRMSRFFNVFWIKEVEALARDATRDAASSLHFL